MVNMVKLHPLSDLIICVMNQNSESKKAFYEFKRDDIQLFFYVYLAYVVKSPTLYLCLVTKLPSPITKNQDRFQTPNFGMLSAEP